MNEGESFLECIPIRNAMKMGFFNIDDFGSAVVIIVIVIGAGGSDVMWCR